MGETVRRTLVVSAVNIRKGGTLTVLRDCLAYLSRQLESASIDHRIIAVVHDRSLCDYPGIEYIEIPWSVKGWLRRLWCEYVTMNKISKQIAAEDGHKVWTWLSLHDTTPRVQAEHQEVYCQTSFPFLKTRFRDILMDPKIFLFSKFTRLAYRINVRSNDSLIVQQQWFKDALASILPVDSSKIRVIPPKMPDLTSVKPTMVPKDRTLFFYASTADCHKNFECLCQAARLLEKQYGPERFRLVLTISGKENRYAKWLYSRWGDVKSIDFHGFMSKEELFGHYQAADAFIFPSRIETWGLPISEFMAFGNGKLVLNDLPYAHETSKGYADTEYFTNKEQLTQILRKLL